MHKLGYVLLPDAIFTREMNKVSGWWGRGVYFFLCISIILLGVGGVELFPGVGVSAWSVSRTTFFFWVIWKLRVWYVQGAEHIGFGNRVVPRPLFLFFAIVTLSLLPDFHRAGDYFYFFFASMHWLMVFDLFSTRKRIRLLFYLLGIVPAVFVARGILNDMSLLELDQMRRLGFPVGHPNTAGYVLSMSFPLCFAIVAAEKRLRTLALLSCGAQLLGIILTYSRGAWIGLCMAMLSWGMMAKKWKELMAIFAISTAILLVSTPVQQRLLSLIKPNQDPAIHDRIEIIAATLKLGFEHPLFGVGYGRGRLREGLANSPDPLVREKSRIAHAHNVYAELFACTGLLGLGAFLWLLWDATNRILRKIHQERDAPDRMRQVGIFTAFIAFMVTGLGDVVFYFHEPRIFFFTLLALIYRCSNDAGRIDGSTHD